MSIMQFEIAAQPEETDEGLTLRFPDHVRPGADQTFTDVTAYRPNEGQFAMLMATVGRGTTDADRVAGMINFFINILDSHGQDYIQSRLYDRKDPFGIRQVEDIMERLSKAWTGNPTREPSGSTPSPSSTGPKSTEVTLL